MECLKKRISDEIDQIQIKYKKLKFDKDNKVLNPEVFENFVICPIQEERETYLYYCIFGLEEYPFTGGFYLGQIFLPDEFPNSPPKIIMITPNGRFQTYVSLGLDLSELSPEKWKKSYHIRDIMNELKQTMLQNRKI